MCLHVYTRTYEPRVYTTPTTLLQTLPTTGTGSGDGVRVGVPTRVGPYDHTVVDLCVP